MVDILSTKISFVLTVVRFAESAVSAVQNASVRSQKKFACVNGRDHKHFKRATCEVSVLIFSHDELACQKFAHNSVFASGWSHLILASENFWHARLFASMGCYECEIGTVFVAIGAAVLLF